MTHYTDDDLVLHYYGDPEVPRGTDRHLADCAECAGRYRQLADSLDALVFPAAPELGDRYGLELWHRLEPQLPDRTPFWRAFWTAVRPGTGALSSLSAPHGGPPRAARQERPSASHEAPLDRRGAAGFGWLRPLALAAGAVILLVVGFTAGRLQEAPADAPQLAGEISDEARRRLLLLSVADHLEASERVLTDIMNTAGAHDISAEQMWAADLVSASRFYRQDAVASDERQVAGVLEELERALLDIVHSPSHVTEEELAEVHRRVDSAALLFKVRVMSDQLRRQQLAPPVPSASQPSLSRIS